MHRGFFPKCGTPMITGSEARPYLIGWRAGTLDDPELAKPEVTIWASSAPSWAVIDEDLPQEAQQLKL